MLPLNVERHTPPSPETIPTRWRNQTKRIKRKTSETAGGEIKPEEKCCAQIKIREKKKFYAPTEEKKNATEKRQEIMLFLSRDENSIDFWLETKRLFAR